jgi:lipid-A-disaccharide synthase
MPESANPSFFLFAGEPSGDLHGHHLMQALKEQSQKALFTGVGGPEMRNSGLEPMLKMEDFAVMGFTDVLLSLPKLYKQFYLVRNQILKQTPSAVILIDYPDFNLRLAKALRKKGYNGKIVHYISPTVWAWRKSRIYTMEKTLDLLMTIYPFEKEHYQTTSLNVRFIGNPLTEYLNKYTYNDFWKDKLGIPSNSPLIALFPGSRHGEVLRNLPLQLKAAEQLLKISPDRIFAVSTSNSKQKIAILNALESSSLELGKNLFLVPSQFTYELMRDSQTAVAKSGTVTLELALHHRPTVVIYSLTKLNHFIAKYIMRLNLPHYCIVNILAGKEIYPELIEHGLTSENLCEKLLSLDSEGTTRNECLNNCRDISSQLNIPNASQQAAKAVLELI